METLSQSSQINKHVAAASLAFAVALYLALPRPVMITHWLIGLVCGVLICLIGFLAASRSRPAISLRRPSERIKLALVATAAGAVLGAILLVLLSVLARTEPALLARFAGRAEEPIWRPLALAFEASILEEIVFRLFLMSVIAWLFMRIARKRESNRTGFWIALFVSTLAFGFVHLPAWSAVTSVTPLLTVGVMTLNGLAAVLLGFVFWRWGLFYAICCHFAGDIVIQMLGPRILL